MFRRHMELWGTTTRQLAEVSVAFRQNAALNPGAVMNTPITIEDHEASRPIVAPLRLLDYCLISDGAVCLILTTSERAGDVAKLRVLISGVGDGKPIARLRSRTSNSIAGASKFPPPKPTPSAWPAWTAPIDALMCYDNFSPTVLFTLEGLGFCPPGESGGFAEGGALKLGGALLTDTDGGHLSTGTCKGGRCMSKRCAN